MCKATITTGLDDIIVPRDVMLPGWHTQSINVRHEPESGIFGAERRFRFDRLANYSSVTTIFTKIFVNVFHSFIMLSCFALFSLHDLLRRRKQRKKYKQASKHQKGVSSNTKVGLDRSSKFLVDKAERDIDLVKLKFACLIIICTLADLRSKL